MNVCQICNQDFNSPKGLRVHISKIHKNIPIQKEIVCEHCLSNFTRVSSLQRHYTLCSILKSKDKVSEQINIDQSHLTKYTEELKLDKERQFNESNELKLYLTP